MNRTGIILLGWLADTTSAGIYSLAFNIATAEAGAQHVVRSSNIQTFCAKRRTHDAAACDKHGFADARCCDRYWECLPCLRRPPPWLVRKRMSGRGFRIARLAHWPVDRRSGRVAAPRYNDVRSWAKGSMAGPYMCVLKRDTDRCAHTNYRADWRGNCERRYVDRMERGDRSVPMEAFELETRNCRGACRYL